MCKESGIPVELGGNANCVADFRAGGCRVTAPLLAVIDKGLGVRGHCTLHRSVVPVGLRNHPLGVDVPGGEGETTLSVGVDGVLVRLDMFIPVPGTMTNLVDLLDIRPDHDHHVTVLHGDLEDLVVAGLAPLPVGGKEELRVALGPKAHGGRGAQREGSDDRAKLAFAIVVVLRVLCVSKEVETRKKNAR